MTQREKREFLIQKLIDEQPRHRELKIPSDEPGQKMLLRSPMNVRYLDAPKPVYTDLLALVRDKGYFVITTNVDHFFQKAGFEKKRLFYTQGDYGLFQCSEPCCQETLDNENAVRQMVERQSHMRIPSGLLPVCPAQIEKRSLRIDGYIGDALIALSDI